MEDEKPLTAEHAAKNKRAQRESLPVDHMESKRIIRDCDGSVHDFRE
jgi:hypothetical protein